MEVRVGSDGTERVRQKAPIKLAAATARARGRELKYEGPGKPQAFVAFGTNRWDKA
jgi:hypothetical protein